MAEKQSEFNSISGFIPNKVQIVDIYHSKTAMNANKPNSLDLTNYVDPNKIHLFVKAGQDGRSQGACPFCQDVFMQLLIKAETNKFNFDVITINLDNPPKEFKELSIKPPVLFHANHGDQKNTNAIIISDVDEIADYLDGTYENTRLVISDSKAKDSFLNVFSKFSHFIRYVAQPTALEAELEKINNYLKECNQNGKTFLCGNSLTKLDCSLMPRLQHIRIASENLKGYKIPSRFTYLWQYMNSAYQTEAFQKSCPPDREIIWHWSKSHATSKDFLQIAQEIPSKTLEIPKDVNV